MTGRAEILSEARELARLRALTNELWPGIGHHSEAHDDAARQFNAASAAFGRRYAGIVDRVRAGDASALEDAVTYLEARPRCFRSGYIAEAMMRVLSRASLGDDLSGRLRTVVVAEAVGGWTRGSRYVGALAGSVWSSELEGELGRLALKPGGERAATIASAAEQWIASGSPPHATHGSTT